MKFPIYANSKTVREQSKILAVKSINLNNEYNPCRIVINARWDDSCKNGENSFSITAEIKNKYGRILSCGCLHNEIKKYAPEFKHLIKWHLVSSRSPMYYLENSRYWVKENNLKNARISAVWENATSEQIMNNESMHEHLKEIMPLFKADIEAIGFEW